MPAPNQNPMYDPMANKPKLSTMPPQVTNDVASGSLVRPMSPPMPPTAAGNRRRQIGGSSGGNFNPAAWSAANQRAPRPVNVLPGIGMGPMPVGTKPLPDPMVRSGGKPQIPEYWSHEGEHQMGGGRGMENPYPPGSPEYEMWMRKNRGNMLEDGGGIRGGAGGVGADGVWTPPSQEYLGGLQSGAIAPKWAGAPGSDTYQGWLNLRAMRGDQYGGGQGGAQVDMAPQPAMVPPGGAVPRPPRPPRPLPGGGMRPAMPDAGIDQSPPLPQPYPQPRQWDPRMGSGYYGAF